MEQSFYLKESKGPGAYLKLEPVKLSNFKDSQKFSMPKNDRGLLGQTKTRRQIYGERYTTSTPGPQSSVMLPGPSDYRPDKKKLQGNVRGFAKQTASRDIPFAKYSQ